MPVTGLLDLKKGTPKITTQHSQGLCFADSRAEFLRDFSQARGANHTRDFSSRKIAFSANELEFFTVRFFAGLAIASELRGIPKKESSVARQRVCLVAYRPH